MSTNQKHTPLPWTNQNGNISGQWETGEQIGIALVGVTKFCGDEVGGPKDLRMTSEDKANAQLIVHSVNTLPEVEKQRDALLSALSTLLKMVEDGDYTTVELSEARQAIALCEKGGQ